MLLLFASQTIFRAQGYAYNFTGSGAGELDGSFIILSGNAPYSPNLSSLSGARILDSYGSGVVFDILAAPNATTGFDVASYYPNGFSGQLTCEVYGYLGVPSVVVLSGYPGYISFSRNLFFPGNASGGAILGAWIVTTDA